LQRIIHIGPKRAQQILRLRPFRSIDDMTWIKGIGRVRLAAIKAQRLACVPPRSSSSVSLAVDDLTVTVPMQLAFRRDRGFMVQPYGISWAAQRPRNLARITVQWRRSQHGIEP
jgi:hypothetical protein